MSEHVQTSGTMSSKTPPFDRHMAAQWPAPDTPMSGRKRVKNTGRVVYITRWPGPGGVLGGLGAGGRAARVGWRADACAPVPCRGHRHGAGWGWTGAGGTGVGKQAGPGPVARGRVAGERGGCSQPHPHGGAPLALLALGRHGHHGHGRSWLWWSWLILAGPVSGGPVPGGLVLAQLVGPAVFGWCCWLAVPVCGVPRLGRVKGPLVVA